MEPHKRALSTWQQIEIGIGISVMLLIVLYAIFFSSASFFVDKRWLFIVGILPSFLVLEHALFIWASRPGKEAEQDEAESGNAGKTITSNDDKTNGAQESGKGVDPRSTHDRDIDRPRRIPRPITEIKQMYDAYYGPGAILSSYGLSIALNIVAGFSLAYVLWDVSLVLPSASSDVREGILYGGIGGYVYVIMMLGGRTFKRDVSMGAALWSAVQMVLGPILGGVTGAVASEIGNVPPTARHILFFCAGLSPRSIVTAFRAIGERIISGPQVDANRKVIPLSHIRGVTADIEDRLFEEGITDAYVLAMANPMKMSRNTPFDDRQILAWIDEALLISVLPDHAVALQKEGITGAIDLAYYQEIYYDDECRFDDDQVDISKDGSGTSDQKESLPKGVETGRIDAPPTFPAAPAGTASSNTASVDPCVTTKARLTRLAARVGIDPQALWDTVRRLYTDRQVGIIWWLYYDINPYSVDDEE
jgi:hypothetical protein